MNLQKSNQNMSNKFLLVIKHADNNLKNSKDNELFLDAQIKQKKYILFYVFFVI